MAAISWLCIHFHIVEPADLESGGLIFEGISQVYFTGVSAWDALIILGLILLWGAIYVLLSIGIEKAAPKVVPPVAGASINGARFAKYLFIASDVIFVCWLPYMLSWFPGGIYSDTYSVIDQVEVGYWSNRHTFFYTVCWHICFGVASLFGGDMQAAAEIITVIQLVSMAFVLGCSVVWLRAHGICKPVCIAALVFCSLFPWLPMFAMSVWKDIFFCEFMLLFSLKFIDICLCSGRPGIPDTVKICILAALVSFSRNNGAYIVFASCIVLLILKRRQLKDAFMRTGLALGLTVVAILVIQGPIYTMAGLQVTYEENIGIPLQQMAAVVSEDAKLTIPQLNYLNSVMPIQGWSMLYRPLIVDSIKWHEAFNIDAIANDLPAFWQNYISIGLAHPLIYLKAAFANSSGFWDPFIGWTENIASYNAMVWYPDTLVQYDFIQSATGFSIRGILEPAFNPSAGLYAWIMLLSATVSIGSWKVNAKKAALLSPLLLLWLTLMVATPIAISQRYFFAAIFMLPVIVLLPFIARTELRVRNRAFEHTGADSA